MNRIPPWGLAMAGLAMLTLLLAALAAMAPAATLNLLSALNSRRSAEGLPYGPLMRHRFDLYRPTGSAPPGGWPLVVFFYGGAWNRGERADYRFVGEALAARGIVVMLADYRLHPQVRYPAFVQDSALAVAHALDQAVAWQADPTRVHLMGHSAGAYNAAMVALDPRWLSAAGHRPAQLAGWIGLAGPYDFLPITTPEVQQAFGHPDAPADSQPIRHAAAAAPLPALLLVGEADQRVNPRRNSHGMARTLQAAGAPVRLVELRWLGHETLIGVLGWPLHRAAPVLEEVDVFVHASSARRVMAASFDR